ncbi:MAG: SDR family NAD(P)-dependent oxidoreductase, partial [Nitrospirota bacterium]|nr:SDR family NAD(P)-dependent oxidoreductase [Nitrospirota bacterium]
MTRSGHETASARGRRALIVGGSGGIGRETAFELASLGIEVVVHGGHSAERLERTVDALRADGGRASGFLHDIMSPGEFVEGLKGMGTIDILVVAFGPFIRKSLAATTTA